MATTPPLELLLLLADADADEKKIFCPSRRKNTKGYVAHSCSWTAEHPGSHHHDVHTGAVWVDNFPELG